MRRLLHIATVHILSMLCVIDLSLILFNTSSEIYSNPKESDETKCVRYLFYHRDF